MRWSLPLLLLAAIPAGAQTSDWPDCYCTDSFGARVELGGSACLVINGHAFLARCEMALNVPNWKRTGEGCVSSGLQGGAGGLGPGGQTPAVDPHVLAPETQS